MVVKVPLGVVVATAIVVVFPKLISICSVEPKPSPTTVTMVPTVPDVGEMVICAYSVPVHVPISHGS